jgi:hypothetical protein
VSSAAIVVDLIEISVWRSFSYVNTFMMSS